MDRRLTSYTGCLLGLAAGDGLGQGQERINGFLSVSGYTQMAAYGCNGLLLGLTHGQLSGAMAPPVRYIARALEEWARMQLWRQEMCSCWISRSSRMEFRRCPEPEVLDTLAQGLTGTMEESVGSLDAPGALMTAVAAALFYDPERLRRRECLRLGAEAAALTHGVPDAFLTAAALTHILSRILFDGITDMERLSREAGVMLLRRFAREYPRAFRVMRLLKKARSLARSKTVSRAEALAQLGHNTAAQALAGALYICVVEADFAQAVQTVSGECPGGAAVAGAILGAIHGEEAIPEKWLEELECADVLRELGEDMFRGCPMMMGNRVFDIEWDEKYAQGEM